MEQTEALAAADIRVCGASGVTTSSDNVTISTEDATMAEAEVNMKQTIIPETAGDEVKVEIEIKHRFHSDSSFLFL